MSYVDLLDTVKSAHPNKLVTDWWRISSHEMQSNAISLAKTELMIRLLHGETILVSNNQAFDSVAFLETAAEMSRMSFLERPPVALAYFKPVKDGFVFPPEWTPSVLVDLIAEYLEKREFITSAWIGLGDDIRHKMLDALKSGNDSNRFVSMVEKVYLDIDSNLRNDYRQQARNLQVFFDYLRKLHGEGKSVVRKTVMSDRLIWNDLDDLRYHPSLGIPFEVVSDLDKTVISNKLHDKREDRSILYNLIEGLSSPLREDLRKYIDIYYNQKIGASVSPRGRGTYTMTDHDPDTPAERDEQLLEHAESINENEGIVGEIALKVVPDQATALSTLTWDDVERVLNEEKILRDSAYDLQDNLSLYGQLDRGQPDFAKKYSEWEKITDEALEKHHILLASLLAPKIKYDAASHKFVAFVAPLIGAVGGGVAGTMVGYAFQNPVAGALVGVATAEALSGALSSVFTKVGDSDLETTAAGSIHESLQKSVSVLKKD